MRLPVSILWLLTPALVLAEEPETGGPPAERPLTPRNTPAISLLPDGSVLQGVMLPRYDENRKLIGVLRAETITLMDSDRAEGTTVSIELFNPDRSPRGHVNLTKAVFDQKKGLLEAREPVEIHSERFIAKGSGLVYAFEQSEGFLLGPATTWIKAPPATAMNTSSKHRATAGIGGLSLLGASLLSLPVTAAPPAWVTPEEIAALKEDAATRAPELEELVSATRTSLAADARESDAARQAAVDFLKQASLLALAAEVAPAAADDAQDPGAKPLDVQPGKDDTVITCDKGMYFDAEEGILVYLGNVKVVDPRFTLSGANELKIFFEKKAPEEKKADKEEPKADREMKLGGGVGNLGDVQRIVASGAVHILQKGVDGKDPIEASGALLTYNIKSNQIIISGGYPWVKQGRAYFRAKEPNLNLRILTSGSFATEGDWEMGAPLDLKR